MANGFPAGVLYKTQKQDIGALLYHFIILGTALVQKRTRNSVDIDFPRRLFVSSLLVDHLEAKAMSSPSNIASRSQFGLSLRSPGFEECGTTKSVKLGIGYNRLAAISSGTTSKCLPICWFPK